MQTPFRPEPLMPAHAYTTYAITRPAATHYRPATCAEVECEHHLRGWTTTIDTNTDLGVRQANYIRLQSGRKFTVSKLVPQSELGAGVEGVVIFTFPGGQECFAAHRVPVQREPLYVVRNGDHRGNPTGERRVHTRGELWVEDMREHLDVLATEISKG